MKAFSAFTRPVSIGKIVIRYKGLSMIKPNILHPNLPFLALQVLSLGMSVTFIGCARTAPPTAKSDSLDLSNTGIISEDFEPVTSIGHIAAGDLVQVSINDIVDANMQTTVQKRVSVPEGKIALPKLDYELKISGMTDIEAQRSIQKVYLDAKLLTDPKVIVTTMESRGCTFTILGQGVDSPGEYPILKSDHSLLNAIANSRAHTEGQTEIIVVRKNASGSPRRLRIPVGDLMSGDPRVNITMRPGDLVILPMNTKLPTTQTAMK